MKKTKIISLLLVLVLMFTSCGEKTNNEQTKENAEVSREVENEVSKEAEENNTDTENKTVMYTDSCGREVEIPAKIKRIAPSGPLAQQVLMSIAPDELVAIAQEPKGDLNKKILQKFQGLPEMGQFYGKLEFNAEALVSANPDIIIDIGEAKKTVVEDMDGIEEKTGVPTIFIELNFDGAPDAYRELGRVLGKEEKAEKLATYIERILNEKKDGMEKVGEKLSFVYLTGDDGLGSNPKGSFHMQMLDSYGENAFVAEKEVSSKGGGNTISEEELISLDPDVIIFGPGSIYENAKDDPVFGKLTAIKNGRYVETPQVPYNWLGFPPSVNRYMGAQWIGNLFYPENFDYDLKERIKEYFDLFYSYELSDEEYEEITKNIEFK